MRARVRYTLIGSVVDVNRRISRLYMDVPWQDQIRAV